MNRVPIAAAAVLLVALSACLGRPARDLPDAERSAEKTLTLPSGTSFMMAAGWTATTHSGGFLLRGAEDELVIDVLEMQGVGLASAAEAAWTARRKDFDRAVLTADDVPGRGGWDAIRETRYKTSPEENRFVGADAFQSGDVVVVILADLPAGVADRRFAEIKRVWDTLHPPGYEPVSYADRTPHPLDDERLDAIRAFVNEARKTADVPGIAVALVNKDSVIMAEGFGVRERGKPERVTADTLFMTASNGKSLTTLLLAKLVDDGYFDWDTPVVEVYPDFFLGDAETTKKVLIKHLVCACTGLPRRDLQWMYTHRSLMPKDVFGLLASTKPTTDFGETFQYSNPLAAAAGFVAAYAVDSKAELGVGYDQAMGTKLFEPLGMKNTTFSFETATGRNHATPHAWNLDRESVPIDVDRNALAIPVRPAGGGWSSVSDFARYIQLELNNGRLADGTVLVSETNIRERWKHQVRTPWAGGAWYGMGLVLVDVHGVQVVVHGGSLNGFTSQFFLVPDLGIGGVMLTNSDTGGPIAWDNFPSRVLEILYDGKPEAAGNVATQIQQWHSEAKAETAQWTLPPDPELVHQLAPRYRNLELGDLVVRRDGDHVVFEADGWTSRVASKRNPDGTVSFITADPGYLGRSDFAGGKPNGLIEQLVLRRPQHSYTFEAETSK